MIDDQHDEANEGDISKSAQKRKAQEYRNMAEKLLAFNTNQLHSMALSNTLLDALLTGKKLKVGNALRRQLSYISKLIQKDNNEVIIANTFKEIEQRHFRHQKISANSEIWRDKLLAGENHIVGEFIQQYPHTDRQQLNQYVRNAQKENNDSEKNKKKYCKQLFNFICNTIENEN